MTRRPLLIVLAACALLRLLFLCTYPLNVSGDGATYAHMMRARVSNLAHAGGYPFLLGLPASLFVVTYAEAKHERSVSREADLSTSVQSTIRDFYVQGLNHLVDLGVVALLYWLIASLSTPLMGALGAAMYGLNPWHVQWATVVRPEPMQSALLLAAVAAAYAGWRGRHGCYPLAAVAFAFAFLVKPNSLLLAPLPVAILLLDRKAPRVKLALQCAGSAVIVVGAFLLLYHWPSTGTFRLDYLVGHNLYIRVLRNPTVIWDPDNGPATKQAAVLRRALPEAPVYGARPLFSHVDAVPNEYRQHFRNTWLGLSEADWNGAWHRVQDQEQKPATTIHYHLGLDVGDTLLRRVFFESIYAHPRAYLAGSATLFFEALTEPHRALVPVPPRFPGADERIAVLGTDAGPSRMLSYPPSRVWPPGAEFISGMMLGWRPLTLSLWVAAMIAGVCASCQPADGARRWGPLLVLVCLLCFFAWWSLIFDVRNKDMRAAAPLLDGLTALGLYHLFTRRRHDRTRST